jgi:hypothetical protein
MSCTALGGWKAESEGRNIKEMRLERYLVLELEVLCCALSEVWVSSWTVLECCTKGNGMIILLFCKDKYKIKKSSLFLVRFNDCISLPTFVISGSKDFVQKTLQVEMPSCNFRSLKDFSMFSKKISISNLARTRYGLISLLCQILYSRHIELDPQEKKKDIPSLHLVLASKNQIYIWASLGTKILINTFQCG